MLIAVLLNILSKALFLFTGELYKTKEEVSEKILPSSSYKLFKKINRYVIVNYLPVPTGSFFLP